MMNQLLIVGRLTKNPEINEIDGKKNCVITLAVGRPYKNQDGIYDTDFLDCTLWAGVAESTAEYCKKGDVVGVRGRVQSKIIENKDGTKNKQMEIIADKITFLSSKRSEMSDDLSA